MLLEEKEAKMTAQFDTQLAKLQMPNGESKPIRKAKTSW